MANYASARGRNGHPAQISDEGSGWHVVSPHVERDVRSATCSKLRSCAREMAMTMKSTGR